MVRFGLFLLVGFLVASSSGALELLLPEPCSAAEFSSGREDRQCAPSCTRCHCASVFRLADAAPLIERPLTQPHAVIVPSIAPDGVPHAIWHVPKPALA
jgi:hypothetical protein